MAGTGPAHGFRLRFALSVKKDHFFLEQGAAVALNAHVMKTKTFIQCLVALLALSMPVLAAPRAQDLLSTRSTKYGTPGEVEVSVIPHPSKDLVLLWDNGRDRDPRKIRIAPGKEVKRMRLRSYKGWVAVLTFNGAQLDSETATRKTGMQTRVRL